MSRAFSIEKNKQKILFPNSAYERRIILQHYFKHDLTINAAEREILNTCKAEEKEAIAIIGYLLNDQSPLNTFRLRIGSTFRSDPVLAQKCAALLNPSAIKAAEDIFFDINYVDKNEMESKIIYCYVELFNS